MTISVDKLKLLQHVANMTKKTGACTLGPEHAATATKCEAEGLLTMSTDGSNAKLTDAGRAAIEKNGT